MITTTGNLTTLAYETAGTGTPVVLLHGLTFDRTSWRPIVDELDGAVHTIAIDLPSHGESPGPPTSMEELTARLHGQLGTLDIARPLLVGHSYGAAVASMYAASYPSLGLVTVDNGPELLPFAELVQRVAPMLRGPGFAEAWAMIENSLGLDQIPEPVQSLVRAGHRVDQDVVLGYWDPMLNTPPADLQAYIDSVGAKITVPVLAVYGNPASEGDRRRFQQWPDVRVEEHPGDGHFVHLVDPARFAESLCRFITHCATTT